MQNINGNSPQPEAVGDSQIFRISLITFLVGCGELIVRKFKCELGEFNFLFWINFVFLLVLFYWPTYLAKKFDGLRIDSLSQRFNLFFKSLLKVAFYMLFIAIVMAFIVSFIGQGVSDSLVFLPLLFFWPIYVFFQLKQNIKKVILPLVICIVTLLAIQLLNPSNPTVESFDAHLKAFEEVVSMVRSGELQPAANGTIKLPCKYRYLVGCPNRKIDIEKQGNTTEIFFCNDKSRFAKGISGFVYRSDGKDISVKPSGKFPEVEVRKLKDHWFWKKTRVD